MRLASFFALFSSALFRRAISLSLFLRLACRPMIHLFSITVVRYRESRSEPYADRRLIVIANRASAYGPSRSESAIDRKKVGRLAPSRYDFAFSKLDRCDARDVCTRDGRPGKALQAEDRRVFGLHHG